MKNLLRITFFAGLFLLLIMGALLAGAVIRGGGAAGTVRESAFHRNLREYDFKYRQIAGSGAARRQDIERLDGDLNRLEKQAEAVESWLSALKRRRQLARLDSRYEESYRMSAQRAVAAFPHSEPLAAIYAAALVHNTAITRENETYLRNALPLMGSRFGPLRLSFHVLLGDFRNAEQALASLPRDFMSPENFTATELEREVIFPDLTILKILAGDIPSAAIAIQTALDSFPSPGLIRFAAEYFYDFGSLLRAAELFSLLPDETAIGRQADALWLAGFTDAARAVWTIQTTQEDTGWKAAHQVAQERVVKYRALYNLAITAPTAEEETALLERLVEQGARDDTRRYGLIHLSRLLDAPQAVALLDGEKEAGPLVGLETLKRRTETEEIARVIGDTWLMLGRYGETEYLYEWGAWYFDLYRNYGETALLLKAAARQKLSGYWADFHQALVHIREGDLNTAADLLASASAAEGEWAAAANLGRVLEASLAPARALEQYQRALEVVVEFDAQTASRIQVRIANCLRNMGRRADSRRALEYALELNPDNLTARLELNRLDR